MKSFHGSLATLQGRQESWSGKGHRSPKVCVPQQPLRPLIQTCFRRVYQIRDAEESRTIKKTISEILPAKGWKSTEIAQVSRV